MTRKIKRFAITLFLLAIFTGSLTAQDKGTIAPDQIPGTAVYIPYPVSITVDGNTKDWKGIPVQKVENGPYTGADKKQNQYILFSVAADQENLYIYMESEDSNIISGAHDGSFWNEDSMEFYVNFSEDLNARSYTADIMQININATNIHKKGIHSSSVTGINASNVTARVKTFKTAGGWAFEAAIPLKGGKPSHGKNIGFQVHANGASEKDRDSKLIWGRLDTDDQSYKNPSVFGRGIFFKKGETDIPLPQNLGKDMGEMFISEGAVGKKGKKIVWQDEFSYKGEPDQNFWDYDASDSGKWNQELQVYTDSRSNSFVKKGKLTIRANRNKKGEWSSARLITRKKKEWTYGYFEIKAKLPEGKGTWPAIWMMPASDSYGGWPNSGEIDIMEYVGFDPDKIHTSVHTQKFNHRNNSQQTRAAGIENVGSEFHLYAMEWTPDGIFWYVDDEPFYFFINEGNGIEEWPFNKPFYLILNVAMGGSWGGMMGMDPKLKKAEMVVDYVRVYQ